MFGLLDQFSLRFSLITSICVMGTFTILSVFIVSEVYRDIAVENQSSAFEEIIRLRVEDRISNLESNAQKLGQSLQFSKDFRSAYAKKDKKILEENLNLHFHRYFVTAGVLKLNRLRVYDVSLNLLAQAVEDQIHLDSVSISQCNGFDSRLKMRRGSERLKSFSELCVVKGIPHMVLITPIGGLKLQGYVEVLTDPLFSLKEIEKDLGVPMQLVYMNGNTAYESKNWPKQSQRNHGIISRYTLKTKSGEQVVQIIIRHDARNLRQRLSNIRNSVLVIALLIVAVLIGCMLFILKRTALDPLLDLTTGILRLQKGSTVLGTTVDIRGNKEIRGLATGFNKMSLELMKSYDELNRTNNELKLEVDKHARAKKELQNHRDHLEELVTQRTADVVLARDAALQATKSKSQFLANMSHELRTPLNAIIGYSEILIDDITIGDLSGILPDVNKINTAGKHLLTLINDILDLSKIEAGKIEIHIEKFSINILINEILDTIKPLVDQKNNRMDLCIDEDVNNMVGDITKIRQILLNIIGNAVKFTENGIISVNIWREIQDELVTLKFAVSDTGVGISTDQLARVFKPFTQADESTTRKYGGTGLGLVISRRFANLMGGDINVESTLGQGSTFTVYIPEDINQENKAILEKYDIKKIHTTSEYQIYHAEGRITDLGNAGETSSERRKQAGRVLVIDDDHSVLDIVTRSLTKKGFDVCTASSSLEGLKFAREFKPDVITLDVMMPGMDGWNLLLLLKQDDELKKIPVVMLSIVDDKPKGFALGASEYLTKPFDKDKISLVIGRCIRKTSHAPILIVDDSAQTQTVLKDMLDKNGWKSDAVIGSKEAITYLKSNSPPTLIILDLMMPEMDGFQLMNEIQKNREWSNIPLIVLTGMDLTPQDRKRFCASVKRVLQKGAYSYSDLIVEVGNYMNEPIDTELDLKKSIDVNSP